MAITRIDFYPASMDARAAWLQNSVNRLTGALATKYKIAAAVVTALAAAFVLTSGKNVDLSY